MLCPYPQFVLESRGFSAAIPGDCNRRLNLKVYWTALALQGDLKRRQYGSNDTVNVRFILRVHSPPLNLDPLMQPFGLLVSVH
jgi:hypothetical protein